MSEQQQDAPHWAGEVREMRHHIGDRRGVSYTQDDLAHELGVSRRTVQRWEHGTQAIHPTWLRLLAEMARVA